MSRNYLVQAHFRVFGRARFEKRTNRKQAIDYANNIFFQKEKACDGFDFWAPPKLITPIRRNNETLFN